jgi:preprotein translocase subunit SecG
MIIFLMVLYVIICILLVAIILLQPSEGGGLSQAFGGGQVQTVLGTKTVSFLVKTTAVLAALFLSICLILAVISSRKERSLLESQMLLETEEVAEERQPVEVEKEAVEAEETAPVAE